MVGSVADDVGVAKLEAKVDWGALVNITSLLSSGSFTFVPTGITPGAHTVTFRVTDSAGHATETNVGFTLNSPPTANAGGNRTVEQGGTLQFTGAASTDAEGIFSYHWAF